jgi:hypothetical protein
VNAIRQGVFSVAVAVLLIVLAPAASARAAFGFTPGAPTIQAFNAADEPYDQAGGHPARIVLGFAFNTNADGLEGNAKDISFDFPPGFSGDPSAVAACPRVVLEASGFNEGKCDPASQVGVLKVKAIGFEEAFVNPIYNVEPSPGQLAAQGAVILGKMLLSMRLRADDFGLTIELDQVPQPLALGEAEIELWGVPADHQEGPPNPRRPFITMPTRCDRGPLAVTGRTRSWQEQEHWVAAVGSTGVPLVGCAGLPFDPTFAFQMTSRAADSPSGASMDLTIPQNEGADDRASASPRAMEVSLPAGVSISPGAVAGLEVCTDADLGVGQERAAACPPSSRVGELELEAPQLGAPLRGGVYLGAERPGERFRLFLVAAGSGVSAKLIGVLNPDPATGRIGIAFDDLPSVGLEQIRMRFDGGPEALLATPVSCGKLMATASFERYDGLPSVGVSSESEIVEGAGGGACPGAPPFSPHLSGGTTSALAGHRSGLTMTLSRGSGEQLLRRFAVTLPKGLSGSFDSVARCADGAVAAAACPVGSRVGSVVAAVGSGGSPAVLGGDVYLTGPYRRAPFGLALVFPARIGRFDLGSVAVRAALGVNPLSGRLSVQSDLLPDMIEGVPVRFQSVGLDIDRADFVRTPTSCDPATLDGEVQSTSGARALVSTPFHIRGCRSLRFSPRLSVGLTEPGQLHRDGHPGVKIAIRARPGDTNLRSIDIGMPEILQRDLGGLRALCARQDAREGRCSAESRIGRARGVTPLFRRALLGSTYLVQPVDDGPPELWTTLDAEGVRLSVRGRVFSRDGRAHARLVGLPDMPLSKFVLSLDGGADGLLALASSPCSGSAGSQQAGVALEGQNHAYLIVKRKVAHPACAGSSGKARGAEAPVGHG